MECIRLTAVVLLGLSIGGPVSARTTWHVDDDCDPPGVGTAGNPFCTIQDGVDAASNGDTVLVAPGTYTGEGNRDISLFGKAIELKSAAGPSETVIDIQGGPDSIHRAFFLVHGESCDTVIEGFSIINGYLAGDTGGSGVNGGGGGAGIYIRDSSPTIRSCVVRDNVSASANEPWVFDGMGAGIYVDGNSRAIIEGCIIMNNVAGAMGGAMRISDENSKVIVHDCVIAGNFANARGGGIYNVRADSTVINSILFNNSTVHGGGGLYNEQGETFLSNCVLWANQSASGGAQVYVQANTVSIGYSAVEGGSRGVGGSGQLDWGSSNIDADPLFIDPENGDFRLLPGSPCIDAGNNLAVPAGVATDLDGRGRFADDDATPDTGNPGMGLPIVDIGAYEFGPEDCNLNGIDDPQEVADGAADCDANNVPDDCQADCNANNLADVCDIAEGLSTDCNCNRIPDDCEADCNNNGEGDTCDLQSGFSDDCDENGIPDECDTDCNNNGQVDACELADGQGEDCNLNGVPDECEVPLPITQQPLDQEVQEGEFVFFSISADTILPEFQWRKDGMDLTDTERIIGSDNQTLLILNVQPSDAGSYDCVVNDIFGCANISDPAALTVTGPCPADLDGDGDTDSADLAHLLVAWDANPDHPADFNGDGQVDAGDLADLLSAWGPCL